MSDRNSFINLFGQPEEDDQFQLLTEGSVVDNVVTPTQPFVGDVVSMSNEELTRLFNSSLEGDQRLQVEDEIRKRHDLAAKPITEAVKDPYYWERLGRTALVGPTRSVNGVVNGLPAVGLLLASNVSNNPLVADAAANQFEKFSQKNDEINNVFNISDPIRPEETLAEAAVNAAFPGSILTKATAVGSEFVVDQSIREATDDVGEQFETVFDRLGITNNQEEPMLSPVAAIGAAIATTTLTSAGVAQLKKMKINQQPISRPIKDIDATAPEGVETIERASDLTKANIIDEQQALVDLAERAGVPNLKEVEDAITLDTHAAARTRVKEAIRTGKFTSNGRQFNARISPQTLYSAYANLDPNTKTDVARYINLLDVRDDINIAIAAGKPGNLQGRLAQVNRDLNTILSRTPVAQQFSLDYNNVTGAVRTFLKDGLFSQAYKRQLDQTRGNYVPLEMTTVDVGAPFLQRLAQAQQSSDPGTKADWFLNTRQSTGVYDLDKRIDPFDALMEYSQAALTSQLQNDVKLKYIDELTNSAFGGKTIRLKQKGEEVDANRTVSVYRNGEEEVYVTSKLQASLLRFDPYIAKYPALFIPKRIAEQFMVGPLSITFAPVTAIRDTIGGAVVRPDGLRAANPLQVASAVPKQLWAKAQAKIAEQINAGLVSGNTAIPQSVLSANGQANLANKMSNSYLNTVYHLANESGGFDASLMKNTIETATGTLQEIQRTLRTAGDNIVTNNSFTRLSANAVASSIDGFIALFAAIQDAPRFAALEKTVKAGGEIADTTRKSRQLTGDVTRSGRVFDPQGRRIEVDAVDQGLLNVANKPIGVATELTREATPFFNPMVQGTRNLIRSYADDPMGTNLRAWQYVGLPSVAAYGFNEMLGAEYNDYAMDRRSARDTAMSLYIGVPGRPPEEGIEIPLMHELLFYGAPFTRAIHDLTRNTDGDEVSANMSILSQEILQNSLDVGFPVAGAVGLNALGMNAPDSIARADGIYNIREDDIGFLPENIEVMVRTMFSSVGDTAIKLAYSLGEEESDYETWNDTIVDNIVSRTPIAKNVTGKKKANVGFSIPNEYNRQKWAAVEQFREYYDAFYNPKRFSEDGLEKPASKNNFTQSKGRTDEEDDLAFRMIGPEPLEEPTNPLIKMFGDMIVDEIQRNDQGMSGIVDRERTYNKLLRQLRKYNAGDKTELAEWQALLKVRNDLEGDDAKLQEFIIEHNIDLSTYDGRVKMINVIEAERSKLIRSQLDIFEEVEGKITQQLQDQGIIGMTEEFDIAKHLKPFTKDFVRSSPD